MGEHPVSHDPFCENYQGTCCPWMSNCDCQCTCARIREIRDDERRRIVARRNTHREGNE